MSLVFTCPQLTEESSVPAAARMCLHTLCNFYQIESIPQFLELWSISMHFDGTLILLYFIEMLPRTVSELVKMSGPPVSERFKVSENEFSVFRHHQM